MSLRKVSYQPCVSCSSILAVLIIAAFGILCIVDLYDWSWNEIAVPNLSKLTEEQVEEKLDELDLDYVFG
jgi:hypothetical protein